MIEVLGFCPKDRLVIINADDFGITHSTNQAIVDLFHQNSITSASLMVPCLWAREAVILCQQNHLENVGIHLTLTSAENQLYRPVCQERTLNSLITKQGFFPRDVSEVELNADPEEVRAELEAQIQAAISFGIDPTHLDSHAGSVMGLNHGRDFLEVVFDLCEKFELPFNLPLGILEQPFISDGHKERFKQRIKSARSRGIPLIDDLSGLPYPLGAGEEYEVMKKELISKIIDLKPGITQITTHPSLATEELKALTPHYRKREMEYRLFSDPEIKALFEKENIKLISWKIIRAFQRNSM
ncbi:polysaccharide deacetylase family protein [Paenibacillus sp. J2TS4]|uniref:polysaccharide deacetylase family protein n=1 Tax=Paenibacillus sp. J2TS4 TaxID=2807194 RepID=UPI001B1014B3|nr:polysaccharide deacetylase family protein [Paenibacillus sp. J2TS4]GIP36069.1 carbohydrate deacetylase [Paenibacillus sp. J2TS4]